MSKISFSHNIDFYGFNLGDKNISYPLDQTNQWQIESSTNTSLVYSFINDMLYDGKNVSARYMSAALSKDQYIVYRQEINSDVKKYLATINNVDDGFYDYNVASNEKYKYIVETNPADKTDPSKSDSVSLETLYYVNPHWRHWSICDLEKDITVSENSGIDVYVPSDNIFIIKGNVDVGSISDNIQTIKYNTLGKHSRVIQNQQKYDSGNISCLINDFEMSQTITNNKNIIVDNTVTTPQEIEKFFLTLSNNATYKEMNYFSCMFIFPRIDNTYYAYDTSKAYETYSLLQKESMENWSNNFQQYYKLINQNGVDIYQKLDYYYKEAINVVPTDFEGEAYLNYYILTEDGVYIQNVDSYNSEMTYYTYECPEYRPNIYYQKIICSWAPVNKQFTLSHKQQVFNMWRECVSNGKLKLLKAPNGCMWVVTISDANSIEIDWQSSSYPATISFNWQEVVDKDKISIIKW